MQCTAIAKRTQQTCRAPAVTGKAVCRLHGGKSPSGPLSGRFKTGRYSKDLPTRLAVRYQDARTNPELLSIREEVAVVETRFRELLARIDRGDLGSLWKDLAAAKQAFHLARGRGDTRAMGDALNVMETLIDRGASDWVLWEAIGREADRLARLRQAEHKRLVDMQQMMSVEQASLFLSVIVSLLTEVLQKHVSDKHLVRRIYGDFSYGLDAHLQTTSSVRLPATAT